MAYDPYKSLLANATREHLKRSADLNTHLVGNVFLPAIGAQHNKMKPPGASATSASFKHLKVIEQCIMAENKREERLAKCTSLKERRVLTKKFQVQRDRERDLIEALMLGKSPENSHDLELLEIDTVAATTIHQELELGTLGLTAVIASPDRVFHKASVTGVCKAKPHAYKKFALPECNGSPGRKGNLRAQAAAAAALASPSRRRSLSPKERQAELLASPATTQRSPVRSARSRRSLKTPADHGTSARGDTSTALETATVSPTTKPRAPHISPQRPQLKEARAAPLLTSLSTTSSGTGSPSLGGSRTKKSTSGAIVFEGATSFSEAQHLVDAFATTKLPQPSADVVPAKTVEPQRVCSLIESATQTTDSSVSNSTQTAVVRRELPLLQTPALHATTSPDTQAATPRRPQSCPVVRSTRQSIIDSLALSSKSSSLPLLNIQPVVETSEAAALHVQSAMVEAEAADHAKGDGWRSPSEESTVARVSDAKQLDTETSAVAIDNSEQAQFEGEGELHKAAGEGGVERGKEAGSEMLAHPAESQREMQDPSKTHDEEAVATNAEALAIGSDLVSAEAESSDEDLETDVAEVLFDLVDTVAAAVIAAIEQREKEERAPSPRVVVPRPRSSMNHVAKPAVRIQSLFRGYRARIAFRLALYEDALSCGVLGAMPGTTQGRSGWYLDPKRLMAYYFVIPEPDGEWEQKLVLRCSRLVLTPHEMQQEVLSKVTQQ